MIEYNPHRQTWTMVLDGDSFDELENALIEYLNHDQGLSVSNEIVEILLKAVEEGKRLASVYDGDYGADTDDVHFAGYSQ